jgi:hypothetical protein
MKLTQWHKGTVKPIHIGVYQKEAMDYSFWNGKFWNNVSHSIRGAIDNNKRFPYLKSTFFNEKWRGLAKKPKGMK